MLPPSLRQTTCTTCRSRECCSHFLVAVTGQDVARIAQTLKVAPAQFVQALPMPDADPRLGFLLSPSGERLHLALRKQASRAKRKPCVFLLSLSGGRRLCGLGDLRPTQCQRFPVLQGGSLAEGEVAPRLYSGPGCWRTWHLGELDVPAEVAALSAQRREQDAYAADVAAWNDRIQQQHSAFQAPLAYFLSYLLNRHAAHPGA